MNEKVSKRNPQAEELVSFLSFFRKEFDLPDIPVKKNSKKENRYSLPRLPDFSKLNEAFTQENELDFCNKSYKANKKIIKEIQEKQ